MKTIDASKDKIIKTNEKANSMNDKRVTNSSRPQMYIGNHTVMRRALTIFLNLVYTLFIAKRIPVQDDMHIAKNLLFPKSSSISGFTVLISI